MLNMRKTNTASGFSAILVILPVAIIISFLAGYTVFQSQNKKQASSVSSLTESASPKALESQNQITQISNPDQNLAQATLQPTSTPSPTPTPAPVVKKVVAAQVPSTASNDSITITAQAISRGVTLTWEPKVPGPYGFKFFKSTISKPGAPTEADYHIFDSNPDKRSFTFSDLTPGTPYYFKIAAFNGNQQDRGFLYWSNEVSAIPLP